MSLATPDTTCHMSISLDGFAAWHLGHERANEADETAVGGLMRPRGAYVMGRNMFGPIRGEWEEDWRGWWGPEPPYHAPVFVLTHHAHEPIEMDGGTTFHFVTDGFDAAYAQARETAGDDGVDIAGGASTVRQALVAGVADELTLDIAPGLLGAREEDLPAPPPPPPPGPPPPRPSGLPTGRPSAPASSRTAASCTSTATAF